jgi:hypothetical protein
MSPHVISTSNASVIMEDVDWHDHCTQGQGGKIRGHVQKYIMGPYITREMEQ